MTFVESIKTCFSKYANFSGRASRSEYWWFVLFIIIGSVVTSVIGGVIDFPLISLLFVLAIMLPAIAAAVRRLHDVDKSGWMYLINLVPFGSLYILYLNVQQSVEPNRFGPGETAAVAAADQAA